ncbi:hypothetical protein [Roseospira navarrensis]|uniref:Uncharacterized protein n=1 Tax=Roseospira navarrensis TaxID=140058 RepID=A0A7X2D4A9_9PROT|nr:hypothetical protein [Roseospira navarrensis]MQX36442.1 hypothetical protein [Roseospira navarrensis]
MTSTTETASATETGGSGSSNLPDTVQFEHVFFHKVDDLYFCLEHGTEQPLAVVSLGEEKLSLPFPGIQREFKIEPGSRDGVMLSLLAKGLKYVKGLRIGDPVPKEVTSGEASWSPKEKHKQIAYHRLAMQLLGWLSGDEHVISNPDELMQVAGDPTFRKQVNDAFGEAARALGLPNKEAVTEMIQGLSHELAYIEALRDEFAAMQRMLRKTELLRRLYKDEHSQLETANSLIRLVTLAVADFGERFETVDAQTGEIMAALKNLDTVKSYLHKQRDDLRARLVAWGDLLVKWNNHPMKPGRETEDLMLETFRFLAPRYMPVDEWVMMSRLQDAEHKKKVTEIRIKKEKKIKYMRGRMHWN